MHPSISEQLTGLSRALGDVIRPELHDPYPLDVLDGVIAGLETIARAWTQLPTYLRWDAAETATLLQRVGVDAPLPPADPLDLDALEAHHAEVRRLLEAAIPTVRADAAVDAAVLAHVRARIERFPFQQLAPRRP